MFTPGSFVPNSKFLLQGLLPILRGPKLKILGPKHKIFTPSLLRQTQNLYSGVFCPILFLHLKSFLAGRQFHDDNEVKEAVTTCFAPQAASLYDEGIQKLVQRYNNCLKNGRNYVEY
jgi:hypothetical protein